MIRPCCLPRLPHYACNHMKQGHSRETVITDAIAEQIEELVADGYSVREIANAIGVSKSSVGRYTRELKR